MNKEFTYLGYRFNIKIELNTKSERHPNGKRYHKATLSDMGVSNFYKEFDVEDSVLIPYMKEIEDVAKHYVDERKKIGKSENELRLMGIGFK